MEHFIAASNFCDYYNIRYSFLEALEEHGLIEIIIVENKACISEEHLPTIEKMIRLHVDLDINIEGIETIHYLLERIQLMQEKMVVLQNRLSLYESP